MKRSRIDNFIMGQEGLARLSRKEIEAVQLAKLNRILAAERDRGGYYSNFPPQLQNLEELGTLPFTTDEDLAHHAGGMLLLSQSRIQRVLSDATSGTTGTAKRVFYTEEDCENTVGLFMAGLGEMIFPGNVTMICFPFSGPHGLGELIAEAVTRLGARPLKLGVGLSYGELHSVLDRDRPDTFVGMPVQLLSMLRACGRGSIQRALVSGDGCPESVIAACEKIIGCKLFPHYGSREMGLGGAITCQAHEGMHLRENHVIAEVVDEAGQVLPHGEWGELVITTIGMEAMPLIRYRTGDTTRILPEICPCGSEVLRLDNVRRKESEDLLELDEEIFRQSCVVDYRAERRNGRLHLSVLTYGAGNNGIAVPDGVETEQRPVTMKDRPLYAGKRKIME